jgi:hypothetical protein
MQHVEWVELFAKPIAFQMCLMGIASRLGMPSLFTPPIFSYLCQTTGDLRQPGGGGGGPMSRTQILPSSN